ncbi:hypothetical protein B7463_g1877, partial [Scytalidium lignicola]
MRVSQPSEPLLGGNDNSAINSPTSLKYPVTAYLSELTLINMTLVFKTPLGSLTQVQIGPADLLTTFSAAYSAAGWLGSLDGVRFLVSEAKRLILPGNKPHYTGFKDLIENQPRFQDSSFYILTSDHGPLLGSISNADDAFGGDTVTQVIGMTICALAHELGGSCAVDLFLKFLAPSVFEIAETIDALRDILHEEEVLQKLLNEGVTRGLPEQFLKSVASAGLPAVNRESYYKTPHPDDNNEPNMVGGLLKWITERKRDSYWTRSGLVARIALYLKDVGYNIRSIQPWGGFPPTPRASASRAVILVLGGSEQTDHLMTDLTDTTGLDLQLHYTFQTVGSMLHQSLAPEVIIRPEILQTEFEFIFDSIASRLHASYSAPLPPRIPETMEVTFVWSSAKKPSSSIEAKLASLYFPLIAEHIAPCYSKIANEKILNQALKSIGKRGDVSVFTEEEAQFRTTTTAIIICLVSRLCVTDFKSVRHSTCLELLSRFGQDQICGIINHGFSSSLSLNEAVGLIAIIHTGIMNLSKVLKRIDSADRVIGWRNGIYCVLPSLLLNMKPSASSVAMECKDVFFANIRTHNDGSIRDSYSPARSPELHYLQHNPYDTSQQSIVTTLQSVNPWIGPVQVRPPNQPLYINIERPIQFRESDICLAGRLDGNRIGVVSIIDVLVSIARSVEIPPKCIHKNTANTQTVLNISTSEWLANPNERPAGTAEIPAYLAVHDNPAWALFAAGECANFHNAIVFECVSCTIEAVARRVDPSREDAVVLIGYQ